MASLPALVGEVAADVDEEEEGLVRGEADVRAAGFGQAEGGERQVEGEADGVEAALLVGGVGRGGEGDAEDGRVVGERVDVVAEVALPVGEGERQLGEVRGGDGESGDGRGKGGEGGVGGELAVEGGEVGDGVEVESEAGGGVERAVPRVAVSGREVEARVRVVAGLLIRRHLRGGLHRRRGGGWAGGARSR